MAALTNICLIRARTRPSKPSLAPSSRTRRIDALPAREVLAGHVVIAKFAEIRFATRETN